MAWLAEWYLWLKAFHVMAVIAWMAGLFYLPRLYVYHVEQAAGNAQTERLFQTMEVRLLRVIMNPAMVAAWGFGVLLALIPGVVQWGAVWPWSKLSALVAMTAFHMWLAARRRDFLTGSNRLSGRQYRIMNEVPTVLMVVIVLSVIVKF